MALPTTSRRGQWRDTIELFAENGQPIDLTAARLTLSLECQRPDAGSDYGLGRPSASWPHLRASTDGTGVGTLTRVSPTVAEFVFTAEHMTGLWPGTYVVSLIAEIDGDEDEAFRETMVVF